MAEFFRDDDPGDADSGPGGQFLPSGFVAGLSSDAPMPEVGPVSATDPRFTALPQGTPAPSRGEYAARWRDEPAPAPQAQASQAAEPQAAQPPLPPRSCRLDDGRVVTMRLTNAFHDFKMRELWAREGISIPADALGSMVLYAVCALDRISAPGAEKPTEYMLPHNRAEIEGRLQQFSTGQSMILAATYMEVEGLLVAGDQFRPGSVASQS